MLKRNNESSVDMIIASVCAQILLPKSLLISYLKRLVGTLLACDDLVLILYYWWFMWCISVTTTLHYPLPYSALQNSTLLYSTLLYYFQLRCTLLYTALLYSTTLTDTIYKSSPLWNKMLSINTLEEIFHPFKFHSASLTKYLSCYIAC